MHSIRKLVLEINNKIFAKQDWKLYGIAELVKYGQDGATVPSVDEKYIGVDDVNNLILYHRLNSLTSSILPKNAYGNSAGDIVNTYSMWMFVFTQNIFPEEISLYIQSQLPDFIQLSPYKNIRTIFSGSVLDSQTVWNQEYKIGDQYALKQNQYLTRINYILETTFSKGCFRECP